jgi:hypothetical protein
MQSDLIILRLCSVTVRHAVILLIARLLTFTNFFDNTFYPGFIHKPCLVLISLDAFRCLLHHPQEHSLTQIIPWLVCPF